MADPISSPQQVFSSLGYADLRTCKRDEFRKAQNTRADVFLLEYQGHHAVLKDYSHSSKTFSVFIGPFLAYREVKALRKLSGIRGVPGWVHKVTKRAFLMEYFPAQRISQVQDQLNWLEFIAKTEFLVERLHLNGVVHGDLRNATNILVDEDHNPVFIDFVSAVHRGHRYNPFSYILYKLCLEIDHGALYKLKDKYAPELIADSERKQHQHRGPLEKTARWVSVWIRRFFQKVFS